MSTGLSRSIHLNICYSCFATLAVLIQVMDNTYSNRKIVKLDFTLKRKATKPFFRREQKKSNKGWQNQKGRLRSPKKEWRRPPFFQKRFIFCVLRLKFFVDAGEKHMKLIFCAQIGIRYCAMPHFIQIWAN